MASAQVLKKQEHLEAGKKKLEEFRRKRAAKKVASTYVINEKQPSETEDARLADSNGVVVSDKEYVISSINDFGSSGNKSMNSSLPDRNNGINASDLVHSYTNNEEYRDGATSTRLDEYQSAIDKFQSRKGDYGALVEIVSGIGKDHKVSSAVKNYASSSFTSDGLDKYPSKDIHHPEKDVAPSNSTADIIPKDFFSSLSNSRHQDNKLTTSYPESHHSSSNLDDPAFGFKQKFSIFSDVGEKKTGINFNHLESTNHLSSWTSDEKFSNHNFETRSSMNQEPSSPPASGRRLRPSFLDSIQITKGLSPSPLFGTEITDISCSKVYPVDGSESAVSQRQTSTSVASSDGVGIFNHIMEDKHNFFSQKHNEDFAALEQHIEDLTQEKFSLQRALEASRALAESLASENSALTDSFNQQGTVVTHLKSDLERVQEEIRAQLVELKAVKMEYANAQLECDAADERAKLLASEVIALEEKALRLRSNELKLERELENTQAEISLYRKKMSTIEKDRQDLQSTIDALQEERKLVQSKLWKASSGGESIDFNNIPTAKTDVSTSTEDLDCTDTDMSMGSVNFRGSGTVLLEDEVPGSQFSPENVHVNLEGLPVAFPSDQKRMIQNINTLIVELALEKDQLMQALLTESSQSFKLLELNKELTRKLESQTQRLELLMAQSMANNNQLRRQDIQTVHESTMYADEGDEVVERVLGWIIKLFPGGPSRQRPSKHL